MPYLYLLSLVFDETNRAKMLSHGVTMREALEVMEGDPKAFRNHSEGGAPWILIGSTIRGRLLTLPLDPTGEQGVWRPRTGYDSSIKEQRRYGAE